MIVCAMGDGGAGEFVGGGGMRGCDGSVKGYSDLGRSSKGLSSLRCVGEDSVVGDAESDDSELWSGVVVGVIVSARGRETKRPFSLG